MGDAKEMEEFVILHSLAGERNVGTELVYLSSGRNAYPGLRPDFSESGFSTSD